MNKITLSWLLPLSLLLMHCVAEPESTAQVDTQEKKVQAVAERKAEPETFSLDADFGDYWYRGKAELTGYALQQSRYGEIHEGEAVLVFVTEPFSARKQVKLDQPGQAGEDKVSVLKLNYTKKFLTGIYPYSLMTSVFTPVQLEKHPQTLKLTTTSQEWCGHTFMQLNWTQGQNYDAQLFSYFESEGDVQKTVSAPLLEDELWTRLRLDPQSIPTGEVEMMPASMYLRLMHRPMTAAPAEVSRSTATLDGQSVMQLRVYYPRYGRELKIYYHADFPHVIEGWDETYQAPAWTGNSGELVTSGRRLKTYRSAYWSQHFNIHRELRAELGLETE